MVIQAIKVWKSICEEEISIEEGIDKGIYTKNACRYFARGALSLVPILLQILCKIEMNSEASDNSDCHTIKPYKEAQYLVMLLSLFLKDEILPHAIHFVASNTESSDWKMRYGVANIFGLIVKGPSSDKFKKFIEQNIDFLIQLLNDPHEMVRKASSWSFFCVYEFIPKEILTNSTFYRLLNHPPIDDFYMNFSIELCNKDALKWIWALPGLAIAIKQCICKKEDKLDSTNICCTSNHFESLIETNLSIISYLNQNQIYFSRLAYETLIKMINKSPKDCFKSARKTILNIFQGLDEFVELDDSAKHLQSLFLKTLQDLLYDFKPEEAAEISNNIMSSLMQIFNQPSENLKLQEVAFLTVSSIVRGTFKTFH